MTKPEADKSAKPAPGSGISLYRERKKIRIIKIALGLLSGALILWLIISLLMNQ